MYLIKQTESQSRQAEGPEDYGLGWPNQGRKEALLQEQQVVGRCRRPPPQPPRLPRRAAGPKLPALGGGALVLSVPTRVLLRPPAPLEGLCGFGPVATSASARVGRGSSPLLLNRDPPPLLFSPPPRAGLTEGSVGRGRGRGRGAGGEGPGLGVGMGEGRACAPHARGVASALDGPTPPFSRAGPQWLALQQFRREGEFLVQAAALITSS